MQSDIRCPAHPEALLTETIGTAKDQFFGVGQEAFSYKACPSCGAWVLDPRPAPAQIGHYYQGYYPEASLQHLKDRAQRGRRIGGTGRARAIGYVRRLRKLGVELSSETKLLDVGCGLGSFAGAVQKIANIEARGVDFSVECKAFAKAHHGLDVDQGELIAQRYEEASFDLVTSWHYMEHVYEPLAELQEMARITRPGGILMVETPTPDFIAQLFRRRWLYLMPPTHLYHYRPKTLSGLIEQAGFEIIRVIRPWFPGEVAGSVMLALGLNGFVPKMFGPKRPLHHRLLTLSLLLQMVYDIPLTVGLALIKRSGLVRIFAKRR